MIDVKLPVRKAFYDLLMGALTYNTNLVPVVDNMKNLGDASPMYVLLSNQTGNDASTFQTFDSSETIVLDIVYKAGSRANRDAVDNVAAQILPLVLPAPGTNGLNPSPTIQLNCVQLHADGYLNLQMNSSNTVIRRLLTFRMHCRQTGLTTPTPPIPSFTNPINETNFTSATQATIPSLNNRSYLLYLNGVGFLTAGTQWNYIAGGGFEILLPNFDSTKNSYTFYLLLQ